MWKMLHNTPLHYWDRNCSFRPRGNCHSNGRCNRSNWSNCCNCNRHYLQGICRVQIQKWVHTHCGYRLHRKDWSHRSWNSHIHSNFSVNIWKRWMNKCNHKWTLKNKMKESFENSFQITPRRPCWCPWARKRQPSLCPKLTLRAWLHPPFYKLTQPAISPFVPINAWNISSCLSNFIWCLYLNYQRLSW